MTRALAVLFFTSLAVFFAASAALVILQLIEFG